jgi:protein tyrosine phosphatase
MPALPAIFRSASPVVSFRQEDGAHSARTSPVTAELRGVSNSTSSALRTVLAALSSAGQRARNVFVSIGNVLTSCVPKGNAEPQGISNPVAVQAERPAVSGEWLDLALHAFVTKDALLSAMLADPEQRQSAPLGVIEVRDWFRKLAASLDCVLRPEVEMSAPVRARLEHLKTAPMMSGMTPKDIGTILSACGDADRFDDAFKMTPKARTELQSYFAQLRPALIALAHGLQGSEREAQMSALYSAVPVTLDEQVDRIVLSLGVSEHSDGPVTQQKQDPRYQKLDSSALGARFKNATNAQTRVGLANGTVYAGANRIALGGNDLITCCYPRQADLPGYFAMLMESNARVINVLMAQAEIDKSNGANPGSFPTYFAKNGSYGDFTVKFTRLDPYAAGSLDVELYDLFITNGTTGQTAALRVNHVTNWMDFKGVDAQGLEALAGLPGNDTPDFVKVNHCRGGLGRAGTLGAALGVMAGMSTAEAITELRLQRSPEMVQTAGQVRALVELEQLRQGPTVNNGPAFDNLAFEANESFSSSSFNASSFDDSSVFEADHGASGGAKNPWRGPTSDSASEVSLTDLAKDALQRYRTSSLEQHVERRWGNQVLALAGRPQEDLDRPAIWASGRKEGTYGIFVPGKPLWRAESLAQADALLLSMSAGGMRPLVRIDKPAHAKVA